MFWLLFAAFILWTMVFLLNFLNMKPKQKHLEGERLNKQTLYSLIYSEYRIAPVKMRIDRIFSLKIDSMKEKFP